jgi:hypothetical protein
VTLRYQSENTSFLAQKISIYWVENNSKDGLGVGAVDCITDSQQTGKENRGEKVSSVGRLYGNPVACVILT